MKAKAHGFHLFQFSLVPFIFVHFYRSTGMQLK